jgi:hypothetical protein
LFDRQANGISSPQGKGQFQLIWSLIYQQFLNTDLLFGGQFTLGTMSTAAKARFYGI